MDPGGSDRACRFRMILCAQPCGACFNFEKVMSVHFQDGSLRLAVRCMFNSELEASQTILNGCVFATPGDPLAHSLSAAVPFYHFVGSRLRPHGEESMQELILGKGIGLPANIEYIGTMLQRARRLARVDLSADPRDQNALLALCVAEGVERDSLVLVYKRWMAGLEHAQEAGLQARRLLEVNRQAYDAYYVIGLSEYVLSQVPAVIAAVCEDSGGGGGVSKGCAVSGGSC